MDRVWVVISSPDDLVQLKEQLLKPDPNERKPQGQARANVLFGAGLAAGRRPVKDGAGQACWPYLSVTAAAMIDTIIAGAPERARRADWAKVLGRRRSLPQGKAKVSTEGRVIFSYL